MSTKIKESKDGSHLVLPIAKKHAFGDVAYQSIDFVLLEINAASETGAEEPSLGANKVGISVGVGEEWTYDLTPTLTKHDGFRPYLFFMSKT